MGKALVIAFVAVLGVPCLGETALFPLKHVDVMDVTRLLRGEPPQEEPDADDTQVCRPPVRDALVARRGVQRAGRREGTLPDLLGEDLKAIWPLVAQNAFVVEGSPEDIDEFRELLDLLDQLAKRISVDVKVLLCGMDAGRVLGVEWRQTNMGTFSRMGSPGPTSEPLALAYATGSFNAQISAAEKDGSAKVVAPAIPSPVVVRNNQMKTVWLTEEFAGIWEPTALASAVGVRPRVNADDSVTVFIILAHAFADRDQGARMRQVVTMAVRVPDGDSILIADPTGGRTASGAGSGTRGEEGQQVMLLVTPRIVFDGRQARAE